MSAVRSALLARTVSSSGDIRQPALVILVSLIGGLILLQGF